MIKTTNAGSTAKGGILGRRKRRLPEPASFVTMWQKADNGRPELVRCLLSEARKSVAAATLAERGNDAIKSRRNAGILGSQKSPGRSAARARCRYCGAASESAPQICLRCEQIRERHEPQASIQSIAAAMQADPTLSWNQARDSGWIGDDALQRKVQRTLANRERIAAAERFAKHGPGRLEREGPAVKVSEAVAEAKRAARANFRQRSAVRATGVAEFAEAAE
jgi:hypothetical protein